MQRQTKKDVAIMEWSGTPQNGAKCKKYPQPVNSSFSFCLGNTIIIYTYIFVFLDQGTSVGT